MIIIAGKEAAVDTAGWPQLEKDLYEQKWKSPVIYRYDSVNHLRFELSLRAKLVDAAVALHKSGVKFAIFKNSRCNEQFWDLTERGGFRLKAGATPASAIRDVYANGKKYGFECATAVVIVLYKGVLDAIDESKFNRLFANMLLYDWHHDSDLRLIQDQGSSRALPGDVLYFNNPGVSPNTPQWQGENAVKLGADAYYGHGIGIVSAQRIINVLNRFRRPGSTESAYLTDPIIYPDFLYLSQFAPGARVLDDSELSRFYARSPQIHVRIGGQRFIR
jgi:protein-glutamine gamma-glutamyltransferase